MATFGTTKIYWLCIIVSLIKLDVYGAFFYVTDKSDLGAGTLRQAIIDANANGTLTLDYIYFNLSGSTASDVTISLTQELPALTSNIIIDGTTQPTSLLGNASIRIQLTRVSSRYINGLRLSGIVDVKVFGIYFKNFISPFGIPADDRTAAIYLENSKRVVIGEPGKGNGFGGNYTSVISPTYQHVLEDIKMSSNIIGLNAAGVSPDPNYVGIDLSYLSNSIIGGNQPNEGNLISANESGVSLGAMLNKVQFSHNIIGYDVTKTKIFSGAVGSIALFANGEFAEITISNNYILAHEIGVKLDNLKTPYILTNNVIGGSMGSRNRKYGIELYNCLAGNISNGNEIAYNGVGVYVDRSYPVSILRNSFYCNAKAIEFVNLPSGKTVTMSKIANITATNVSGVYLPNSKIELFYTDECADCQGKEWLATILTDGSGNWNYNGVVDMSRSLTSLGTNQDGATATFSKPLMNENSSVVTDVICNQPTGSIRGIITYDASVFEWRNANGDIVGTNRDLENVPPGTYRLTARQNNMCSVLSRLYTISSSASGISEVNKQVSPAYCGQENGSIRGITTTGNSPRVWYNANGLEVSRDNDLIGVAAGTYFFTTQLGSCNVTSPIYTVNNIEFNYVVAREEIADATCSSNNGSIKVLNYQSDRPDNVKWFNSDGQELGNTENLIGLSPGRYKLVGYSNFGCSYPIKEFVINEILPPTIDESGLKEYISCDGKSVTTSGILVNGQTSPYSYSWVDQNQNVVATTLNLKKAPLGKYTLKVTDRFGCVISGNLIDFTILEKTVLKIPNAFTPNGDAVNDFWEIKGVENYPDAEFRVFNRSGGLVFSSRGYEKPFDGNFKGKNLPVGVYYYKINLNEECGIQSGSLTIIR